MSAASGNTPPFPGAVGLSFLHVYPWATADGLHGGSAHCHFACAECYVTVSGQGRLQLLSHDGYREEPLSPGVVVWFEPGTIHRAVNDGDLNVLVVMQNSGLPEAGDAVMTFPEEYLRSEESYWKAASVLGPDGPSAALAKARRDLSLEGFAVLADSAQRGDFSDLDRFYARASALIAQRSSGWRQRIADGPLTAANQAIDAVDAISRGDNTYLKQARVGRIDPPDTRTFGMCGLLDAYDSIRQSTT